MSKLREKPNRKLRSQKGETLAEALASILIGTLAIAFLVASIGAGVRINSQAQRDDEAFYGAMSKAERKSAADEVGSGTVRISEAGKMDILLDIRVYGGDGLYAYSYADEGEEDT